MKTTLFCISTLFLVGCAGKVGYAPPSTQPVAGSNVKLVDRPRDMVWAASVPELGKQFFVINNLDKASGLINLSYTGDPERYIDCGQITSYVKNARGERNYSFAGSSAQQNYEIMEPGTGLFFIDRRMNLEGRVNLIFEEVETSKTRVTANTRYVVTRSQTIRSAANPGVQSGTHTVSFNSGGAGKFPPNPQGQSPECISTGALEMEILSVIR